jgi:FkbM family methyltransferase
MGPEFIKRGDYWWPVADTWCYKVIHDEVSDIDDALTLVPGRTVCIQAGGNVGVWANYLADRFARVYTFEPDLDNYACLQANAKKNVYHSRQALGASIGSGSLSLVQGNAGAHWTVPGSDFPVTTIDALQLVVCDLIVLDIEGAELDALVGAVNTIERCRPVIHFEEKGLGERYYGHPFRAAEAFLKGQGYRVHSKIRKDVIMVPA